MPFVGLRLPQYRVAQVTVDADHAFGRPRLTRGGKRVDDVNSSLTAALGALSVQSQT